MGSEELLTLVRGKIEKALPDADVELIDRSHKHEGHADPGAHLTVIVASDSFAGMALVEQHKRIYDILSEEMGGAIHALRIRTKVKHNGR